jgi:hypothetical protein
MAASSAQACKTSDSEIKSDCSTTKSITSSIAGSKLNDNLTDEDTWNYLLWKNKFVDRLGEYGNLKNIAKAPDFESYQLPLGTFKKLIDHLENSKSDDCLTLLRRSSGKHGIRTSWIATANHISTALVLTRVEIQVPKS